MKRYVLIRIVSLVPLWLGISAIAFGLINLVPGDAATVIASRVSDVPPTGEQIEEIRREYHLDKTLPVRYGRWLFSAARGDLGISYRTRKPVLDELVARFPATFQIAFFALAGDARRRLYPHGSRQRFERACNYLAARASGRVDSNRNRHRHLVRSFARRRGYRGKNFRISGHRRFAGNFHIRPRLSGYSRFRAFYGNCFHAPEFNRRPLLYVD